MAGVFLLKMAQQLPLLIPTFSITASPAAAAASMLLVVVLSSVALTVSAVTAAALLGLITQTLARMFAVWFMIGTGFLAVAKLAKMAPPAATTT